MRLRNTSASISAWGDNVNRPTLWRAEDQKHQHQSDSPPCNTSEIVHHPNSVHLAANSCENRKMSFLRISAATALVLAFASFAPGAGSEFTLQPVTDFSPDAALEQSLRGVVDDLQLNSAVTEKRLAVSLVDVTDSQHLRYAGLNDREMMYAASLPKI